MRADAAASITRILDAARQVFARGDGSGTLEVIAREAGVGIATLYRHFPNRQTLAGAVYDRIFAVEVEPLLFDLENSDTSRAALLDITERIVSVARREIGMLTTLGGLWDRTATLLSEHDDAFEALVLRGQIAGDLRSELSGRDIPQLLAMLAASGAALDLDRHELRRYLGFMIDGIRPLSR